MLTQLGHWLVCLVVRILVCVLQSLSLESCERYSRTVAWLCADVLRFRHAVIDDNLRHAFPHLSEPERQQIARRMWEHLLLMLVEIAHAPRKIHETNWRDFLELRDGRQTMQLVLGRKPTIFVAAHYGNFELAGFVNGLLGVRTHTVARQLDNPYLDAWLNRFRGTHGQQIVNKKGGSTELLDVLRHGGNLAFLADQYAGTKGCWVEFFGRPASAHKGIALLALEGDATVAVYYSRRLGRAMHYEAGLAAIYSPQAEGLQFESVPELTQWYSTQLEEVIRRAPEQYWWVHRRWKDNRAARRRRRLVA